MVFVKKAGLALVVCLLCGCAAPRGAAVPSVAYDEGYRQGIREKADKKRDELNGNGFPYLGSNWSAPLVQEVLIPAHVQGGVFYPEHNELVVITPGEWQKAGTFPLRSNAHLSSGRVEVLAVDITALPR